MKKAIYTLSSVDGRAGFGGFQVSGNCRPRGYGCKDGHGREMPRGKFGNGTRHYFETLPGILCSRADGFLLTRHAVCDDLYDSSGHGLGAQGAWMVTSWNRREESAFFPLSTLRTDFSLQRCPLATVQALGLQVMPAGDMASPVTPCITASPFLLATAGPLQTAAAPPGKARQGPSHASPKPRRGGRARVREERSAVPPESGADGPDA